MLLVAAEKFKYTPQDVVYSILEEIDVRYPNTPGLIVFGSSALPLKDPGHQATLAGSYLEAPQMPGRPNPVSAILEAVETAVDYEWSRWILILLWTSRSRAKHLDMAFNYAINSGARIALIALRPSKPPWIDEDQYDGNLLVKSVRKNTNLKKLVAEVTSITL